MLGRLGFTLIELVVVMVILGILAAIAVPRFSDLSYEAGSAAAQSVAGTLSSSSANNYAKRRASLVSGASTSGTVAIVGANQRICRAEVMQRLVSGVTFVNIPQDKGTNVYRVQSGLGDCLGERSESGTVTCRISGRVGAAAEATLFCSR